MGTKLIIKGAIYFDGDMILRAHYTGEFMAVDCTEYKTKNQIKEDYSKENAKVFLDGYFITNNGVKYYECQSGPQHTDNMELLSDLSNLEFTDYEDCF